MASIEEILHNKKWNLYDGRGGVVELTLTAIKYSNDKIIARVNAIYNTATKDKADFIRIGMGILPNNGSLLIKTEPNSRLELGGRREILNISTSDYAEWELCYNHKSERFCMWTVEAMFQIQDYKENHQILEIIVMACRKQNRIKRLLLFDNSYTWPAIHCQLSAIDEPESEDVYIFNRF